MKYLFIACIGMFAAVAAGQVPRTMTYQGIVTDTEGNPVSDGSVNVTFRLYDMAENGEALWEENQEVQVTSGIFNAVLGTVMPLDLPFDRPYWLGISIDGGEEMMPRTALTASPYSLSNLSGLDCWDLNEDGICDPDEDINGDGVCDALDCQGPPGMDGADGLPCWDLNGDGVGQPFEDIDRDGAYTVFDCGGPPCWDLNGNLVPDLPAEDRNQDGVVDVLDCGLHCWDNNGNGLPDPNEDINQDGVWNTEDCRGLAGVPGQNVVIPNDLIIPGMQVVEFDGKLPTDKTFVKISDGIYRYDGTIYVTKLSLATLDDNLEVLQEATTLNSNGDITIGGSLHMVDESGDTVTSFNADGTSYHTGSETFKGGIKIDVGGTSLTALEAIASGNAGAFINNSSGLATMFAYNFNQNGLGFSTNANVQIDGDLVVGGDIMKGGGGFKIDHPLDPSGKYLNHSFVESPQRMNVYNGNVVLDENGEAVVELPEWFEALNTDFRYQLTCIGGFAQVYVAEEIENNRFNIAGGTSGLKISWQVTGVRKDAFAKENPLRVEEIKGPRETGRYRHPEAFGQPRENGTYYAPHRKSLNDMKEKISPLK